MVLLSLVMVSCGEGGEQPNQPGSEQYTILLQTAHTLPVGTKENAEIIRAIPGQDAAILISSKSRKLTRLNVRDNELSVDKTQILTTDDSQTESEVTSAGMISDKAIVVTHAIQKFDENHKQSDCLGKLLFVDITEEHFGEVLSEVEVGSMPDAVAVSSDGLWAISADEHDSEPLAWGKCTIAEKKPSVSLISLKDGFSAPKLQTTIHFSDDAGKVREPEYVAIAADNDLVAVTLQDSHEIAMFRISEVKNSENISENDIKIIELPPNAGGAFPWPDGIAAFSNQGKPYFIIAGEWNDTLPIIDGEGNVVSNIQIDEKNVPTSYPRANEANTPLFSPDSLFLFQRDAHQLAAVTLRHAGAVIVYNIDDPAKPAFAGIVKVGADETNATETDGSVVRPEGISGTPDGSFIFVANEKESSVSLVVTK